jgi:acetyltransferase-like isoleucine patch superfamily enzyme
MRLAKKMAKEIASGLDKLNSHRVHLLGPILDIRLGKGVMIRRGAVLSTRYGGTILLGTNCSIESGARLDSYGGNITVGNNCSVNFNTIIYGHGGVTIGNDVRIAANSVIVPANHVFDDATQLIARQGETRQGIIIKDDVWIAAGCTVLDGVTIETGCVIAAGAVVTRSTEPYGIYGGVPARKIKSRVAHDSFQQTNKP